MPYRRLTHVRVLGSLIGLVLATASLAACGGGGGATTAGMCRSNADCGEGQTCSGGTCRGCTGSDQCPAGQVCVMSGARSACVAGAGGTCDNAAAICEAARVSLGAAAELCVSNKHIGCGGATPTCEDCVYGCAGSACMSRDGGGADADAGDSDGGGGDTDGGGAGLDGAPPPMDGGAFDSDGDSVPDSIERPGGVDVDTDGDGTPDYLDPDDDGDGILTRDETADEARAGGDVDGDGTPAYLDTDSDGDGMTDASEGRTDRDGDGIPNYLDPDFDGSAPDAGRDAGRDAGPTGTCGNGTLEPGEGCDPPRSGGCGMDDCSADCRIVPHVPTCGNGCAETDEECGEPTLPGCDPALTCLACTCQAPSCGDGAAQFGEHCGEPGLVCGPGKTCTDCQCAPAVCGDGFVDLGEQCGEPSLAMCPTGQMCNPGTCRCGVPAAGCGNGRLDLGETCGEPGLGLCAVGQECSGCTCRSMCGNGVINAGEDCGEAGVSCPGGSSCNVATCHCQANCGNGRIDSGESCDPPTTPSCASATYCDSTCTMAARPTNPEICNGLDDNCNGMIDEGLRDICFDCNPSCVVTPAPPPATGWSPTGMNSSGVIVDMGGALTLGRRTSESYSVWVANMDDGTVSRLDSRTNREIARYPSIGRGVVGGANIRPWNEACNWSNRGNCPSRTAVDQNFDAYVANRAFGNQGTVTKYANAERDCVDRNMNGVIDTSRDLNGDGRIIDPGEFIGVDDECILWSAPVGANNAWPRALAVGISPDSISVGDVWVGLFNTNQACRMNPATGAMIGTCIGIGISPYGAAAYRDGRIFFTKLGWAGDRPLDILRWVVPSTLAVGTASSIPGGIGGGSYGITIDGADHLWVAGAHSAELKRYSVLTDTWTEVALPGASVVRGVAADRDYLWAGDFSANRVFQVRISDSAYIRSWPLPAGATGTIGVGVSFDGSIFAINETSSTSSRLGVIDAAAGTGTWSVWPVGLNPYTYSDFIGFGLNTFAEPRGFYRWVVTGCSRDATRWEGIRWSGTTPPGTAVEFWVRSAPTVAGLAAQTFIGPFTGNPINLQAAPGPVPDGTYLEIEVRLSTTDRTAAPRIFSVDVSNICIRPG